jgi:hypothetical protein
MHYTFFPTSPYTPQTPVVVMTSNPHSNKINNLLQNPNVSMLVHDWASPRIPVVGGGDADGGGGNGGGGFSGLAEFMSLMTTMSLARISAKLRGTAMLAERGSPEETWFLEKHLESLQAVSQVPVRVSDDVRVIVVRVTGVRVSDLEGNVKDWVILPPPWTV